MLAAWFVLVVLPIAYIFFLLALTGSVMNP